jgi:hypothetical protein
MLSSIKQDVNMIYMLKQSCDGLLVLHSNNLEGLLTVNFQLEFRSNFKTKTGHEENVYNMKCPPVFKVTNFRHILIYMNKKSLDKVL